MEPKLKLVQLEEDIWCFLDYGEQYARSYNHRWLIQYRPNKKSYFLICTFPYTHENGLDNTIKELQLAKEAIDILKANST